MHRLVLSKICTLEESREIREVELVALCEISDDNRVLLVQLYIWCIMHGILFLQITTRRINFIVDRNFTNGLDGNDGLRDHEKDYSWSLFSLHQIYSRR